MARLAEGSAAGLQGHIVDGRAREGTGLQVKVPGEGAYDLVPASATDYVIPKIDMQLRFVREAGKVTSFTAFGSGRPFEAKRLD